MGERDGQQARATATQEEPQLQAQQQVLAPKQTSGAQADQMVASLVGHRSTPPVNSEHMFGEAVVGSDNNVDQIHAPWNLGDTPAMAHFGVSGDGFDLVSQEVMTLKPSGSMKGEDVAYVEQASPKIAFKPRRTGDARGALTITIKWPLDGHVETQTISLRGFGRALNDAPEQGLAGTTPVHEAPQQASGPQRLSAKDKRRVLDVGMNEAIDEATSAAEGLADAQLAGINLAEKDASAYKKALPKAERSIWWDLAEAALTLATGRIATYVAGRLLPRFIERVGTKTVTEDVFTEKVTTTYTPKLGEALTGAIQQGLTTAGDLAIKGALPEKVPAQQDAALPGRSEGHNSSNARIDFFEQQRDWVGAEKDLYHAHVKGAIHRVVPLMQKNPEQAEASLRAVKESFRDSKEHAKLLQAEAVAPAWTATIARMNLGVESAETRNHATRSATKMDATRKLDDKGHVRAADGVLDVYVASGRIVSVQINGVSQEMADRLADMTLAKVPMPIRFVLAGPGDVNPTIITRDEAGRLRIVGDIKAHDHEADNVKTASSMIERYLSTPLSALHLEIKTDDETGRGP